MKKDLTWRCDACGLAKRLFDFPLLPGHPKSRKHSHICRRCSRKMQEPPKKAAPVLPPQPAHQEIAPGIDLEDVPLGKWGGAA